MLHAQVPAGKETSENPSESRQNGNESGFLYAVPLMYSVSALLTGPYLQNKKLKCMQNSPRCRQPGLFQDAG